MSKKPEQEKRPLIATGVMTEFGEVFEDPNVKAFGDGTDVDVTYTPGWSELRRKYDTEYGEVLRGQRPKSALKPLPGHVCLVRRSTANGSPDMTKTTQYKNVGYVPITKDDIGKPWFTELPGGSIELPDGTIAKGDCVYMYCPPEQAARNARAKHQRTMDRIGANEAKAESLPGGGPIEKVKLDEIQLGSQISPSAVPRS